MLLFRYDVLSINQPKQIFVDLTYVEVKEVIEHVYNGSAFGLSTPPRFH
jgi:hypothetical protein